jgi:hypothetical protein
LYKSRFLLNFNYFDLSFSHIRTIGFFQSEITINKTLCAKSTIYKSIIQTMSFLTKTSMPRAAVLSATRMPIVAQRTFTTSPFSQKTVTESVKDGLKKTDRVVSDNIAIPAVDAVAAARDAIKGGAKKVETGEATGEIKGKASELKGQAKGAAAEAQGKVKSAAEQAKSKI